MLVSKMGEGLYLRLARELLGRGHRTRFLPGRFISRDLGRRGASEVGL